MFLIGIILGFLSSCGKENITVKTENNTHISSKDSTHNNFSLKWTSLIDNSYNNGELDISSKYIGIQGWSCMANPPYIYVGATFPKSTFNTSFDEEVTDKKNPIYLIFNFNDPYITNMETVSYNEYLKKIKEAINSEEFSNYYSFPTRPYQVKFAELQSPENLDSCFVDNKDFGNTLKRIVKQELNMDKVKSLCIGKVIFKSFTVSMDTPPDGLFIKEPSGIENFVYVRTLTYGTSAYFIIGSNKTYEEVLAAFKGSFMNDYHNQEGALHKSQIILLTVSDINQEAEIKTTFDDLNSFLKNPFMNGNTYGYPIYCKGFYAKDNSIFKITTSTSTGAHTRG